MLKHSVLNQINSEVFQKSVKYCWKHFPLLFNYSFQNKHDIIPRLYNFSLIYLQIGVFLFNSRWNSVFSREQHAVSELLFLHMLFLNFKSSSFLMSIMRFTGELYCSTSASYSSFHIHMNILKDMVCSSLNLAEWVVVRGIPCQVLTAVILIIPYSVTYLSYWVGLESLY